MKQRVITAIVAMIIFIPLLICGGTPFSILVVAMGLVAMAEMYVMKKKLLVSPEAGLSFLMMAGMLVPDSWLRAIPGITHGGLLYFFALILLLYTVASKNRFSFDDAGALVLCAVYAGFGFHYMIAARDVGLTTILYGLLIVWITDSGAYMIGRQIGKHKLAPKMSPNKTWEGSVGGTVATVILVGIYLFFFPLKKYSLPVMLLITLVLSVAGQIGDLVESAFKRHYGVKDSGRILPGHGGILDRFDSLLFVLPLMHLFGLI